MCPYTSILVYTCTCAAAALYSLLATTPRNSAWTDGVKQNWRPCFRFLLLLRLRFAQIVLRVSNFQLNLHTCDDDRKAMRRCVGKGSCFLVIFRPYRILSFAEPDVPTSAYMLHHCLLHTVCSPLPCDTNTDTSRRTEAAERSGCNNTIKNTCIHESVCNSLYPVYDFDLSDPIRGILEAGCIGACGSNIETRSRLPTICTNSVSLHTWK